MHNMEGIERSAEINRKKRYESGKFDGLANRTRALLRELKRKGALTDRKKYETVRRRFEANYQD